MDFITKDVADLLDKNLDGKVRILYSPLNSDTQIIRIRFNYTGTSVVDISQYEDTAKNLPFFFLKGVKKIQRAMISKIKRIVLRRKPVSRHYDFPQNCIDWPTFVTLDESWVIYTEGTNISGVMSFSEDINHSEIYSNDLVEVGVVLGVEASRVALFLELKRVIEFDGSGVNYRHVSILVDTMTFRGKLTAVNRHGINRGGLRPLSKSSFEEPIDILTKAAMFAEKDPIAGVSDNLILGQMAFLGTASFDLVLDQISQAHVFEQDSKYAKRVDQDNHKILLESKQIQSFPSFAAYSSELVEEMILSIISSRLMTQENNLVEKLSKRESLKFLFGHQPSSSFITRFLSPSYSPSSPAYNPKSLLLSPFISAHTTKSSLRKMAKERINSSKFSLFINISPVYFATSLAHSSTSPKYW